MTSTRMTTDNSEVDLMIAPHDDGIRLSLLPWRDDPAHKSVAVRADALLAAIDAAAPDAMRAYLRETIERAVPAGPAADHFDYLAAEVPEADSTAEDRLELAKGLAR